MSCGPFAAPPAPPPMIKVKRIDHVAIAVGDCAASARRLAELFGMSSGCQERVSSQATDVAFLFPGALPTDQAAEHQGAGAEGAADAGDLSSPMAAPLDRAREVTALELVSPVPPDGNPGLRRFLDRHGGGLHHICFEVDDLPEALATLKSAGVRLIDEVPRPGARGHLVAFLHPASTGGVLFELCASPHGAQPA
jgi:methylmalonyl-CoA/ethylmalonyl-CoA epimerase